MTSHHLLTPSSSQSSLSDLLLDNHNKNTVKQSDPDPDLGQLTYNSSRLFLDSVVEEEEECDEDDHESPSTQQGVMSSLATINTTTKSRKRIQKNRKILKYKERIAELESRLAEVNTVQLWETSTS